MLVSKSDFAAHMGVSAARVSQYIQEGKLTGALFFADGRPATARDRSAKIDRAKGESLLRGNLDLVQQVGQGRVTPAAALAPPAVADIPLSPEADTQAKILALKLENAERDTERDRRKFAAENGIYAPTDQVRVEFTRSLSDLLAGIEAWLPDLAGVLATHASDGQALDRRALLLVIRNEFRKFRAERSAQASRRRDSLTALITDPSLDVAEKEPAQPE